MTAPSLVRKTFSIPRVAEFALTAELAKATGYPIERWQLATRLAAALVGGHPAWVALSTSGLRGLDLPKDVCGVIVLADGDEAGDAVAKDSASRRKRQSGRARIARLLRHERHSWALRHQPSSRSARPRTGEGGLN
jgi:hypothetical protein